MTSFLLNGQRVQVGAQDAHLSLLQFLRERGLTGTKEGCAEGECGACAVVLLRRDARGLLRYEPVNSCLLLTGSVVDHEVLTVEGVADAGRLHPVQSAMVELGGSQCGYCTPGFVMSLFAEYYRPDRVGYDPEAISGNLCRCTGYRPIRAVAEALGTPDREDPRQRRLQLAPPALGSVSLEGARSFHRPCSLDEVFAMLERRPDIAITSGGSDLVVEMNQRHRRFDAVLSLENVTELRGMAWTADSLRIGASNTLTELEPVIAGKVPILEQMLPLFSSRLVRNRATLGGNLGTASPIGDSPPALLALDASLELVSAAATRRVPLADFFLGYRKTALAPGELIAAVLIPLPLPEVQRFYKVSKRVLDDISTVAAGFSLRRGTDGRVESARLAYGGVAATPVRAHAAEDALVGHPFDDEAEARVRPLLEGAFAPLDDHRGSANYRRAMVVELFSKFRFDANAQLS